uniref:Uncharacterized protein n=1 Tax=Rhizophora mucronata TaxID=61149 RepID=A0A2P2QH85_RHIMU
MAVGVDLQLVIITEDQRYSATLRQTLRHANFIKITRQHRHHSIVKKEINKRA